MEHDPNIFRDSSQVIQEVEDELERILQKKFCDVDSDLLERINREKETARKRKEEIERDFDKEKSALKDYRVMVRDFEEQRAGLLNEARERFDKVLRFQAEIDNLAKSTVEEIKRVNEIQGQLEVLRTKTSERAAFLKDDLRERFGIVAEVMDEEPKPLGISLDLDEELEKLKKIKDLLAIESAPAGLGRAGGEPAKEEDLDALDAAAEKAGLAIPELRDLISGPGLSGALEPAADEAPQFTPEAETAPAPEPALEPIPEPAAEPAAGPAAEPGSCEAMTEEEAIACIESYRRTEPANGSGEVHYFQRGKVVIADPEKILAAVDRTLEEGQHLSLKLGLTESPKDQFFIKQELINWQEGLRALFLRVIKMCEKSSWNLPRYTEEIINPQILRRLLERLSMENWSNLEEFAAFSVSMAEIRKAFQARTEPRIAYLLALKKEIEED